MTQPSPSLLAAIAEVCRWHSRLMLLDLSRTLPGGRRQPIIPPEIPASIEKGEIEVPDELKAALVDGVFTLDMDDWPKTSEWKFKYHYKDEPHAGD